MNELSKARFRELKGRSIEYKNRRTGVWCSAIVEDVDAADPNILYVVDSNGNDNIVNYHNVLVAPR